MLAVLVFLAIATLVGGLIRAIVGLRLQALARRPEVTEADLCELTQASRISSIAVTAALAGLAAAAVVYVVIRST